MNIGGDRPQTRFSRNPPHNDGWTEYERHYQSVYREEAYYSTGRGWPDYAPAYRYGYENYGRYRGRHFEDVEAQLERGWFYGKADSRLAWAEARGAVRDIWQRLDQDAAGERDKQADRRR